VQLLKLGSSGPKVKLLKQYLNKLIVLNPKLNEQDGKFDAVTQTAVIQFKTQWGVTPATGTVDAHTWGALGGVAGLQVWPMDLLETVPDWFMNLINGKTTLTGAFGFNRRAFFSAYMEHYGPLSASQFGGLDALLSFIERDPEIDDVRWAAYLLATVKWECADTWQPIEEYGKGAGHAYGKPVTVKKDGKSYTNTYYGRGYVQLTWHKNYVNADKKLNLGDELELHPEKVMIPETAYRVISYGMVHGEIFANGHKFADYSKKTKMDYAGARHMVNGTDHNSDIAAIATQLEAMLRASLNVF
jgi:putative chitinase